MQDGGPWLRQHDPSSTPVSELRWKALCSWHMRDVPQRAQQPPATGGMLRLVQLILRLRDVLQYCGPLSKTGAELLELAPVRALDAGLLAGHKRLTEDIIYSTHRSQEHVCCCPIMTKFLDSAPPACRCQTAGQEAAEKLQQSLATVGNVSTPASAEGALLVARLAAALAIQTPVLQVCHGVVRYCCSCTSEPSRTGH